MIFNSLHRIGRTPYLSFSLTLNGLNRNDPDTINALVGQQVTFKETDYEIVAINSRTDASGVYTDTILLQVSPL